MHLSESLYGTLSNVCSDDNRLVHCPGQLGANSHVHVRIQGLNGAYSTKQIDHRIYDEGMEGVAHRLLLQEEEETSAEKLVPVVEEEEQDISPPRPKPDVPCFYDEDVPRLVSVQTWKSKKTRPRESITLMTQLSDDRLKMLENQCYSWNDPLVAIVYIPLYKKSPDDTTIIPTYPNTTLDDAVRGIDAFHYFMEKTASCVLTIELVGQFLDPLDPEEYPINALRNRAIKLAETEVIFMLDVDFVACAGLGMEAPGYRDPTVYNQLVELTSQKKALVLPAFEITKRNQDLIMGQNFARNMAVAGKSVMREKYLSGQVDAFNGQDAPWGHGPTNTSKWIMLEAPMTYRAFYQPKYEPFLVLNKKVLPWCDERFVGYGGNKIAFINQLRGEGFTFHVHPFGYVIHVPHVKTKAANTFVLAKRRGASYMDHLRALVEREIAEGHFVPHTGFCPHENPDGSDDAVGQEVEPLTLLQHE